MGAWLEGQNSTKVTVVTKWRVSVTIATSLTGTTFHKRFADAVEIVNAGKPLPVTWPE